MRLMANLLMLAILVVIGGAVAGYGVMTYQDQQAAIDRAEPVDGVIVESSFTEGTDSDGDRVFHVTIEFEYEYDGELYRSDRKQPGEGFSSEDTRAEANSVLESYPEGETVTVHVDPEQPDEGFLEASIPRVTYFFIGFGVLFAGASMLFAVGAVLSSIKRLLGGPL